mmetsp:Transcript_47655/g.102041  ORF Transcript_47655/g.102041 Transcript_47655/m.102041 type:complete len:229 (-) Transcript_47655:128-814(-)
MGDIQAASPGQITAPLLAVQAPDLTPISFADFAIEQIVLHTLPLGTILAADSLVSTAPLLLLGRPTFFLVPSACCAVKARAGADVDRALHSRLMLTSLLHCGVGQLMKNTDALCIVHGERIAGCRATCVEILFHQVSDCGVLSCRIAVLFLERVRPGSFQTFHQDRLTMEVQHPSSFVKVVGRGYHATLHASQGTGLLATLPLARSGPVHPSEVPKVLLGGTLGCRRG